MKRSLFALFSVLGLFGSATAGPLDVRPPAPMNAIAPSPVFSDEQFFFDLYGSYLNRTGGMTDCTCMSGDEKMHGFGGGISVGYFVVPSYIVLRADASFSSVHDASREIAADVLLRLPLDNGRWAPYLLVGGGIEAVNGNNSFFHVGAGLEYRLTSNLGLFGEFTYAWVDNSPDDNENLTAKVGVRVAY
jgi:opacity protein-like surface antigen